MDPRISPWANLSTCHGDSLSTLVRLYEPYTEPVWLKCRPACITFFDRKQTQPYGPGLYTSLHHVGGKEVMCNFLQLSLTCNPNSIPFYAKHSFNLSPEVTTHTLYQLCLDFSDIICINAQTELDALAKILSFIDRLECARIHNEPQLVILLETTSFQMEGDERDIKEDLNVRVSKERSTSQWTPRVLQHLVVQRYDPRTPLSALLMSIQGHIATMRKRRKERSHLWAIAEIDYLICEYLSIETGLMARYPNPARSITTWRDATWYPVAFRRQFWPGKDLHKQHGLAKWMHATDRDVDLNAILAPIFAFIFLEDGKLLPHGTSPLKIML